LLSLGLAERPLDVQARAAAFTDDAYDDVFRSGARENVSKVSEQRARHSAAYVNDAPARQSQDEELVRSAGPAHERDNQRADQQTGECELQRRVCHTF
jgi:hypothetical protein